MRIGGVRFRSWVVGIVVIVEVVMGFGFEVLVTVGLLDGLGGWRFGLLVWFGRATTGVVGTGRGYLASDDVGWWVVVRSLMSVER